MTSQLQGLTRQQTARLCTAVVDDLTNRDDLWIVLLFLSESPHVDNWWRYAAAFAGERLSWATPLQRALVFWIGQSIRDGGLLR